MEAYFQAASGILLAVILTVLLAQQGKQVSVLLGMGVCVMALILGMQYLKPVISFLQNLQTLGGLDGDLVAVLLKAAGISLLCDVSVLVCNDSGNQSMGKALRILTCAVLLWLSLPLFQALTELLEQILEEI